MKRSTTLVLVTLIVLALLFSAYLFLAPQPSVVRRENALTPATRRSTTGPTGSLGQGEGAWVKQFDEHTGKLSSQFRGETYDRQPDGRVRVAKPEAQFFLADGQVLHVVGQTGIVTVPESLRPGKDQGFSGPSRPPSQGDLHDVKITLFKEENATSPVLTCVMDNATFDNETFRIFTQAANVDGKQLSADEIPVSLRGVDYDFDGKGLTIRLNQRDRRLEFLEIAHGHHLTIKNPSALNDQLPQQPAVRGLDAPLPEMYAAAGGMALPAPVLAQASRRTGRAAPPTSTPTTRPADVYRASFQHDVRVVQQDQELATGDELQVDFLFDDSSGGQRAATTQPGRVSRQARMTAKSQATDVAPAHGAPAPAAVSAVSSASATHPTSAPATTRPAQPPVTIYWTGKLTMQPIPRSPVDAPTVKNSIVRITGNPIHVRQGSSTITGTSLVYRTGTEHLSLKGDGQSPLALSDGKGAVVHGTSIDYLQQERIATLDGPGSATKILPADAPGQPAKEMKTRWTRSAMLFFSGQANEPLHIETAQLAGAVRVEHPQLRLDADTLKLAFDPNPTTRPAATTRRGTGEKDQAAPDFTASDLRHLDARGSVKAVVISANDRPQSIAADALALDTASTPDGRIYPKALVADGHVVAQDPEQELRAGHLKTALLPTTQPARTTTTTATTRAGRAGQSSDAVPVELEHLTATDDVSIKTSDGVRASANRLDVDVDPATRAQHVRLLGSPAHVASKDSSVTGPFIEILPQDQTYNVRGPGKMHLTQRETPQSKPRPVDVAWRDSVAVDGKANVINVLGDVSVISTDDTGTQNTATGQALTITLADNPNPPATTRRGATTRSTTRKATPVTGIASANDPMQNKVVQSITFKKGASLESVQTNKATNDLLRQMNLMADVVSYDFPHKRVTVPVPGQLLFVNRAAENANANSNAGGNNFGGSRGNTAFSWQQQMVFDQTANLMTMTGDVVIAHEGEGASDKPFRLDADKVVATLAPKATTQPAPQRGVQPAMTDSVDLKHVTAEGTIRFTSRDTQLTASSVDYDPATGVLVARGQGRDPVHLYDPDGVPIGTASEVEFNTKTGQNLRMTDVQAQTRRKTTRRGTDGR